MLDKGTEVEKVWETKSGLLACVLLIRGSHRCGYVLVNGWHPLYRMEPKYDDYAEYGMGIRVHGGVTFTGNLCHVHPTFFNDDWWVGFDCAHYGDRHLPEYEMKMNTGLGKHLFHEPRGHLWTTEDVIEECELLAEQLASNRNKAIWAFNTFPLTMFARRTVCQSQSLFKKIAKKLTCLFQALRERISKE